MKNSRFWVVFAAAMALLMLPTAPAAADADHGTSRPFGGEQVMVLNIDLDTGANLYGCEEITWFGTIELYGRTYGMALYSVYGEVEADDLYHYRETWRIFTGKFQVKNDELKQCTPGSIMASGVDEGIWYVPAFESSSGVQYAAGRFTSWYGMTVGQDGVAPVPVSVAGLEDVMGLDGRLWLEP